MSQTKVAFVAFLFSVICFAGGSDNQSPKCKERLTPTGIHNLSPYFPAVAHHFPNSEWSTIRLNSFSTLASRILPLINTGSKKPLEVAFVVSDELSLIPQVFLGTIQGFALDDTSLKVALKIKRNKLSKIPGISFPWSENIKKVDKDMYPPSPRDTRGSSSFYVKGARKWTESKARLVPGTYVSDRRGIEGYFIEFDYYESNSYWVENSPDLYEFLPSARSESKITEYIRPNSLVLSDTPPIEFVEPSSKSEVLQLNLALNTDDDRFIDLFYDGVLHSYFRTPYRFRLIAIKVRRSR